MRPIVSWGSRGTETPQRCFLVPAGEFVFPCHVKTHALNSLNVVTVSSACHDKLHVCSMSFFNDKKINSVQRLTSEHKWLPGVPSCFLYLLIGDVYQRPGDWSCDIRDWLLLPRGPLYSWQSGARKLSIDCLRSAKGIWKNIRVLWQVAAVLAIWGECINVFNPGVKSLI